MVLRSRVRSRGGSVAFTTGRDVVLRLIEDVNELKRTFAKLDGRTGAMETGFSAMQSGFAAMHSQLSAMQSALSSVQSEVGLMRGALGDTHRTFERMFVHLEAFADSIGQGEAERDETRRDLDDLKRRVAALEGAGTER